MWSIKSLLFLTGTLCFMAGVHAQDVRKDTTVRQYAIPIEGSSYIPVHKLSTQVAFLIGTSVLLRGDRPMPSYYGELKGYYFPTGAIYICTGLGWGGLHSESRPQSENDPIIHRNTCMISLPTGVGFTMGDDRANFFSGVNFTPALYAQAPEGVTDARKFTWGIMPEFGFRFKVGRRDVKGVQLGLVGQIHMLRPPSRSDGALKHSTYAGAGFVCRFY